MLFILLFMNYSLIFILVWIFFSSSLNFCWCLLEDFVFSLCCEKKSQPKKWSSPIMFWEKSKKEKNWSGRGHLERPTSNPRNKKKHIWLWKLEAWLWEPAKKKMAEKNVRHFLFWGYKYPRFSFLSFFFFFFQTPPGGLLSSPGRRGTRFWKCPKKTLCNNNNKKQHSLYLS